MKLSMLQLFKKFFWIGLLALGLQASWAYSLLGPVNNGDDAGEQITEIGYNPLPATPGPPFFFDGQPSGPKNLGDGYRLNTPVLYYTFDPSFGYFGSEGEVAVQQAFDMMNSLSNVDSYNTNLSEFPLNSQGVNYEAATLGLRDLKSVTLARILEQMGLADAVRYDWVLLDRYNPPGSTCPAGGPANGYEYWVSQRNYDITATPLNYNAPDVGQYSPYVNAELYTYFIEEVCDVPGGSPPTADAIEVPADPLANNPPVASGRGEDFLQNGYFYTGLTRDDVAGLRYLMSSNNVFAPSPGYLESPAAGSVVVSGSGGLTITNFNDEFILTTSNLTQLILDSQTNDPTTLQALYPNLLITSVRSNTFNGTYTYTFGNLITNFFPISTNTLVQIQVQSIGPLIGSPYGSPNVTNTTTTTIMSNILSGPFLLAPTNSCGLDIVQVLATNITTITNFLGTGTNVSGFITNVVSTNLVFSSTNYTVLVAPCEFINGGGGTNANVGDYQGIQKVQFVRISDGNYDYQTGQFYQPVTNTYTMVLTGSGQLSTVKFQRVITRPDILFVGENLSAGGNDTEFLNLLDFRTTPNFEDSRAAAGLAGPGIIDPTTSTNIVITFNTVGPLYENTSPTALTGPNGRGDFIWGSFDGTTNPPIVYPNGTSINLLADEALIQISPTTLSDGTNGVSYNAALSATGGRTPYTWSLASNSAGLPPGLILSPSGDISGTPTQSGTFDDIVIQLTDSSNPALTVQIIYSLTIN
jgi:hypothetical protein